MGFLKMKNKRGVLENVTALVVGTAATLVAIVVVFLVIANLASNASVVADGNASNAVSVIQAALTNNVVVFIGLILLVAIAGILIFLVRRGLGGGR